MTELQPCSGHPRRNSGSCPLPAPGPGSYPFTVIDDDDRLEPVALTAATLSTVRPWPTLRVTDQVPSGWIPTGAPLTVTLAPGAAIPEILTSPEPTVTVLRMLTFAPDWFIGCSLPFEAREIGLEDLEPVVTDRVP